MRNAYCVDLETGVIKTARHIAFDEGMIDSKSPPPFVQYLRSDLDKDQLHLDDATSLMQVSLSPFNEVDVIDCRFRPSAAHPLGFQVGHCPKYLRAFATAFNQPFGPHDAAAANRRYLGGYILKVGQHFTFSPDDVQEAIRSYASLDSPPPSLPVMIARDQRVHLADSRPPSLHLRPVDIRCAAALNLVAGEGPPISDASRIRSFRDLRDFVHALLRLVHRLAPLLLTPTISVLHRLLNWSKCASL